MSAKRQASKEQWCIARASALEHQEKMQRAMRGDQVFRDSSNKDDVQLMCLLGELKMHLLDMEAAAGTKNKDLRRGIKLATSVLELRRWVGKFEREIPRGRLCSWYKDLLDGDLHLLSLSAENVPS